MNSKGRGEEGGGEGLRGCSLNLQCCGDGEMERHIGRVGETDAALAALRAKKGLSDAEQAEGLAAIGLEYSGMAQNEKALEILGEALEVATRAGGVDLAKARLAMGKARLRMTLVASAQDNLLLAAATLVKEMGAANATAIDAQVYLVACKAERGLPSQPVSGEEADALVKAAREQKSSELLCNALLCAGDVYDYHGKAVTAKRRMEEATKMARVEGPPLAPLLGDGLLKLGHLMEERFSDNEAALKAFSEATEVLTGALGEEHPTAAFAQASVGHMQALMEEERRDEAAAPACCDDEECACEGGEEDGGGCCAGGKADCCDANADCCKGGEGKGAGCDDGKAACCPPEKDCCQAGEGGCCAGGPADDAAGPLPGVDAMEAALARCERVYGRGCRQIMMLLGYLAFAKSGEQDAEASIAYSQRELEMAEELYSEASRVYGEAFNCQVIIMSAAGGDDAIALAQRSLELHRKLLPDGHFDLAVIIINYVSELGPLGDSTSPETVALLKEAAAIQSKAEHVPLDQSSMVLSSLAEIAQEQDNFGELCRLLMLNAENHIRLKGADCEETLEVVCDAAQQLAAHDRRDDAQNLLILILSKQRILPEILSLPEELSAALETFSGDPACLGSLGELLDTYATILAMEKLHQDAIPIFSNLLALCKFLGGPTALVEIYMPLGVAYNEVGDIAQAMVNFASAAVIFREEALQGGWTEKGLSNEVNLGFAQVKAGIEVLKAVEALKFAAEELIKMEVEPERLMQLLSNVAEVFQDLGEESMVLPDALRYRTICVSLLTSMTEGDQRHPSLALALFEQANCMLMLGQLLDARAQLQKSIEASASSGDSVGMLQALSSLVDVEIEMDALDDALATANRHEEESGKLHGADSLLHVAALMKLAKVHQEIDEAAKVLELTSKALELVEKHSPGHWNMAKIHKARFTAYAGEGDVAAALEEGKLAVEVLKKWVQENPQNDELKEMLADDLSDLGQFQAGVKHDFLAAQKSCEDALAARMSTGLGDCPQIAMDHVLLGSICSKLGQTAAGRAHVQEAVRVARSAYQGQPHPVVGQVLLALSEFSSDPHERIATLTEVASIFMMTMGDALDTADVLTKLGQAFLEANQAKKGKAVLERAWRMLREVAGPQDDFTLEVHGLLTQLYHELGIPGQPDPNPRQDDSRQPPAA